jgi:hypothetical protein
MSTYALRRLHRLSGLFFAPTLLFFALTGVLQVFDLHKIRPGNAPLAFVLKAASLHKNQTTHIRSRTPTLAKAGTDLKPPEEVSLARQMLKAFAAIASAFLLLTTFLGVTLALGSARDRLASALALVGGVVIPLFLVLAL